MLASWGCNDSLPTLPEFVDLTVLREMNDTVLANLTQMSKLEIARRRENGHHSYVAWLKGVPTAYGWVATRSAHVGELDLSFQLPSRHLYLWDFVTLTPWRGLGIYPHLLQQILKTEIINRDRFWIIRAPENQASGRGITKAGFQPVGKLSFLKHERGVGLISNGSFNALEDALLLGVKILYPAMIHTVAPCWRCVLALKRSGSTSEPNCWSGECGCCRD